MPVPAQSPPATSPTKGKPSRLPKPGEWGAAAFSAALGLLLLLGSLGDGLTRASYDLLFATRAPSKPTEVVLVYLDDVSHKVLGQPMSAAWDRGLHAELVNRLTEAGAKAVVFDIFFPDAGPESNAKANREFATALRTNRSVVLGGEVERAGGTHTLFQPYVAFRTNAAAWGLVQLPVDPDFGVRQHLGSIRLADGTAIPSLSWSVAKFLAAELPSERDANRGRIWINYYAPPGGLPSVSYHQAIDPEGVPKGFFKDKIVVVGAQQSTGFTGTKKDEFATAFTRLTHGKFFAPGAEIQATLILNILRGDWLSRLPLAVEALLVVLLGVAGGWGLTRLRPLRTLLVALGTMALVVIAAVLAFRAEWWFAWLIVLVQLLAAWVWAMATHSIRAHVEGQKRLHDFERHFAPEVAARLVDAGDRLKAEEMKVTFLFSDIEDFTTTCDRTASPLLFAQLRNYFDQVVPCIQEQQGTLLQFVGDAIYAVWNAPEPQPDHAARAMRAALRMQAKLFELEVEGRRLSFKTRIGLHFGEAMVGPHGSKERFEYGAVGKDTNLAARLEGLNKYLGTTLLASEEVVTRARSEFVCRWAGHFQMKGSDRKPSVYEVLAERTPEMKDPEWVATFVEAVHAFQSAKWDDAEAGFRKTSEQRGQPDGPSEFYLKQVAKYRTTAPAQPWKGEVRLDDK